MQRAADPVIVVGALLVVLGLAEIGQDVGVGPAAQAELRPAVIVARMAADIDHAVDRGRAADDSPARAVHLAAVHVGLGLAVVVPVDLVVGERIGERRRHVDLPVPEAILPAGLEHEDAVLRLGAEAIGQHAAGRSGANDDVVENLGLLHPPSPTGALPILRTGAGPAIEASNHRSLSSPGGRISPACDSGGSTRGSSWPDTAVVVGSGTNTDCC